MTPAELRARADTYDRGAIQPTTTLELAARWMGIAHDLRQQADDLETAHLERGECLEDGRVNRHA